MNNVSFNINQFSQHVKITDLPATLDVTGTPPVTFGWTAGAFKGVDGFYYVMTEVRNPSDYIGVYMFKSTTINDPVNFTIPTNKTDFLKHRLIFKVGSTTIPNASDKNNISIIKKNKTTTYLYFHFDLPNGLISNYKYILFWKNITEINLENVGNNLNLNFTIGQKEIQFQLNPGQTYPSGFTPTTHPVAKLDTIPSFLYDQGQNRWLCYNRKRNASNYPAILDWNSSDDTGAVNGTQPTLTDRTGPAKGTERLTNRRGVNIHVYNGDLSNGVSGFTFPGTQSNSVNEIDPSLADFWNYKNYNKSGDFVIPTERPDIYAPGVIDYNGTLVGVFPAYIKDNRRANLTSLDPIQARTDDGGFMDRRDGPLYPMIMVRGRNTAGDKYTTGFKLYKTGPYNNRSDATTASCLDLEPYKRKLTHPQASGYFYFPPDNSTTREPLVEVGQIYPGTLVVDEGDNTYLYYNTTPRNHNEGSFIDPFVGSGLTYPNQIEGGGDSLPRAGLHVAKVKRNRLGYLSRTTSGTLGSAITKTLTIPSNADYLQVNHEGTVDVFIQVSSSWISLGQVTGDNTRANVDISNYKGQSTKLKFDLATTTSKIFSFNFANSFVPTTGFELIVPSTETQVPIEWTVYKWNAIDGEVIGTTVYTVGVEGITNTNTAPERVRVRTSISAGTYNTVLTSSNPTGTAPSKQITLVNAIISSNENQITFLRSSGVSNYKIQFATNSNFTSLLANQYGLDSNSELSFNQTADVNGLYPATSLTVNTPTGLPSGTYYWRMRVFVPGANPEQRDYVSTASGSFTTDIGITSWVPIISSPADNALINKSDGNLVVENLDSRTNSNYNKTSFRYEYYSDSELTVLVESRNRENSENRCGPDCSISSLFTIPTSGINSAFPTGTGTLTRWWRVRAERSSDSSVSQWSAARRVRVNTNA